MRALYLPAIPTPADSPLRSLPPARTRAHPTPATSMCSPFSCSVFSLTLFCHANTHSSIIRCRTGVPQHRMHTHRPAVVAIERQRQSTASNTHSHEGAERRTRVRRSRPSLSRAARSPSIYRSIPPTSRPRYASNAASRSPQPSTREAAISQRFAALTQTRISTPTDRCTKDSGGKLQARERHDARFRTFRQTWMPSRHCAGTSTTRFRPRQKH